MPRAVILTALPIEYLAVRSHLTAVQEEIHARGSIYERGTFAVGNLTWDVGIAEIGAGNPNAALEAERVIAYFNPDVILFVGVAGGFKKDVDIGDVVVSTKIYGFEWGKAEETFKPRPEIGLAAYGLEQQARAEARKGEWRERLSIDYDAAVSMSAIQGETEIQQPIPRVFIAPIAAGEKIIASTAPDILKFLQSNYRDVVAVEMEGFGFLEATRANQRVSAIVVRGISDLIDGEEKLNNSDSQEVASHHASAFAFEMLAKFQPAGRSSSDFKKLLTQAPSGLSTSNNFSVEEEKISRAVNMIRQLLEHAFRTDELINLCQDRFPRVYEQFTTGQTKLERIGLLIDRVQSLQETSKLLATIEDLKPAAYSDFKTRLEIE